MDALHKLEIALEDIFKKAPALPLSAKKFLVEYLPWINLAIGLLTLWATYTLWQWAHWADRLVDYANSVSRYYGTPSPVASRLSFMVWVSLVVLLVEAVIYIVAFPALRDRKKSGWQLLFYATLINLLYGFVIMFTDYGGPGSFIGGLIGTAIALYVLFQIKGEYVNKTAPTPTPPTPIDTPTSTEDKKQ